jgi:hypothetical protein
MPADRQLMALAADQHGVLTMEQLRRVLGDAAIRKRVQRGALTRVHAGVFAVAGAPSTWQQRLVAACLSRAGTVVSHWAAAELWQLGARRPTHPIVTFDATKGARRHRLRRVEVHESAFLDGPHVATLRGIPVTSAARTALDLTAFAAPRTVARYVDEGMRRGVIEIPQLVEVFEDLDTRGRWKSTVMRAIIERRLEGFDPGDSDEEVDIVQVLVDAGLPRPAQQHEVILDGRRHELDVSYPDLMIDIEFDGFGFHRPRLPFDEERARQNRLVNHDWTILRFTTANSPDDIVATVRTARARAIRKSGGAPPDERATGP